MPFLEAREAARGLRRAPFQFAFMVATLALAIAVSVSLFAVVDRLLLDPLPAVRTRGIVALHGTFGAGPFNAFSYGAYRTFQRHTEIFSELTAAGWQRLVAQGPAGSERLGALFVEGNYLQVLGIHLRLGNGWRAIPSAPPEPALVISDRLWRRQFGSSASAIGQTIRVNGLPFTVTGVAPADFRGTNLTQPADLFLPLALSPAVIPDGAALLDPDDSSAGAWLALVGRLQPALSGLQANAALDVISRERYTRHLEPVVDNPHIVIAPLDRAAVTLADQADLRLFLSQLALVCAALLVLGCSSVAGVLVARSRQTHRSLEIRAALGAGVLALCRPAAMEAFFVATAAGAAGTLLAVWFTRWLTVFRLPANIDLSAATPSVSWSSGAAAAVLAVVAGLLCAAAPALRAPRLARASSMVPSRTGSGSLVLKGLVAVQLAVATTLLGGALLLTRTVVNFLTFDLGFSPRHLVVAEVETREPLFDSDRSRSAVSHLLERLRSYPGVRSASVTPGLFAGSSVRQVRLDGRAVVTTPPVTLHWVGPDYPKTMGIRVLAGRALDERDRRGSPPVAMVSEWFAGRGRGEGTVVGRQLVLGEGAGVEPIRAEIVGVVSEIRPFGATSNAPAPIVYLSLDQHPDQYSGTLSLVISTSGNASRLCAELRREMSKWSPSLPVATIATGDEVYGEYFERQQLAATLFGGAASAGACLSIVGMYALVTAWWTARRRDVGIRMALGASRSDIRRLVTRQSAVPSVLGLAGGAAGIVGVGRLVGSLLFNVAPLDRWTLLFVPMALGLAVSVAAYLPARQAGNVDPVEVLKAE